MSQIEALYLVSGFWLAALPLGAGLRSMEKKHRENIKRHEELTRLLVEQAKLETWKEANAQLDKARKF